MSESNIYNLFSKFIKDSEIEDIRLDEKLKLLHETDDKIDKEYQEIKNIMNTITAYIISRDRYNKQIDKINIIQTQRDK